MSLFKVVQWLDYQCPDQEKNYDSFSLTCARFNVDNETNKETIIISSHSGYITIIRNPTNHEAKEIIELKLNAPILGVSCGNFVAQPQRPVQNIAILHPTQLAIYSLITPSEAGHETGNRGKLQLIVSHDLEKSAFSFCKGNFGGEKNKEFLCVMFLDGSLRFFEQDFTGQRCILPGDHAIPACFIYVPRTDCFILLSASWDLECYRYLSLSESYERKLNPIWSICVGECIIDINQHQVSNSESLIVLLGEKSLISVSDTGKVKFVRKFDYTPLCFCSFVVGWYFEPNCKLMIGVVTDQGSLLIYHNATLVWCATLPFHPVLAVQRGNFSELNGGLVMLSETGKVSVGYLGSNPVMFKVPPLNLSNLNYENSKQMLEEMEREINANIDLQDFEFINVEASKNFNLTTKVRLEGLTDGELAVLQIDVEILTNLEQIQIFIPEDPTMTTQPNIFFLKDCKIGETHARDFKMYTSDGLLPSSVTILVSFINKQSVARIVKSCVSLPLDSFLERRPPQKDAHFKATLSFSQSVDVLGFLSDLNTEKAIGLKILNSEHEATIIKKANKFRLQSSSIQSLGFFTSFLAKHVKKEEKCQTTLTINSPALDYLIDSIQKYFNATEGMDETKESLNKETSQIRIFERCHLLKMQEKAIKMERSQIDILLLDTIDEILNLSKKLRADGIEGQLKSIVHHFGMIIECIENPQQKKNHQELMVVFRFLHNEETNWLEAVAPFVDYLYSKHELRQFENFSLSKFNKHLRSITSILVDANRIQEDLKE